MSTGERDPLPDFGLLAAYWLGELDPAAEAALEEQLFADANATARLELVSGVAAALGVLGRTGRLRGTLTLDAIAKLRAAGVRVREYTLAPGQIVPCTIAHEDLMVIRLHGVFAGVSSVDIDLEWRLENERPRSELHRDVAVDLRAGEIVLAYAGDGIRALPRSGFTYRVSASGGAVLGEFHLEHTPPA